MVPFNGGAFLPAEQRYTSPIFRRLHRFGRAEWLSLMEAAELVAVYRLLDCWEDPLFTMFQHSRRSQYEARRLLTHRPVWEASESLHQANLGKLSQDDGEAALIAMRDGGYRKRAMPTIVRRSLQGLRGQGLSAHEIGKRFGASRHQVQDWINPRKPVGLRQEKAKNLLLVGAK